MPVYLVHACVRPVLSSLARPSAVIRTRVVVDGFLISDAFDTAAGARHGTARSCDCPSVDMWLYAGRLSSVLVYSWEWTACRARADSVVQSYKRDTCSPPRRHTSHTDRRDVTWSYPISPLPPPPSLYFHLVIVSFSGIRTFPLSYPPPWIFSLPDNFSSIFTWYRTHFRPSTSAIRDII